MLGYGSSSLCGFFLFLRKLLLSELSFTLFKSLLAQTGSDPVLSDCQSDSQLFIIFVKCSVPCVTTHVNGHSYSNVAVTHISPLPPAQF